MTKEELNAIEENLADDFFHACLCGDRQAAMVALRGGAHPDGIDRCGRPLYRAAKYGNALGCQVMLELGANPNLRIANLRTATALHVAAIRRHVRTVLVLIAGGADTALADWNDRTAIDHLQHTSKYGQLALPALRWPLHTAAAMGEVELCQKLMERGFDPMQKNSRRQTAVQAAASSRAPGGKDVENLLRATMAREHSQRMLLQIDAVASVPAA